MNDPSAAAPRGHAILFASDQLGVGPEELGRILLRAFLKTQLELTPKPWRVLFLNQGITLTTTGSAVLPELQELEAAGAEILSCGTCLDYFHAKDALQVGRVSNMREISETLLYASRVIRP